MLLCVGILAPQADFSWIDPDFAEMANQAGQFIPSLIGAGLIVVAIGLSHRVNLAWGLTIFLLVAGAAFTATQDRAAVDLRRAGGGRHAGGAAARAASTATPAC